MAQLIAAKRLPINRTFNDPFSLLNRLFVGWVCRDRFGFLNQFSPYDLYSTLGDEEKQVLDYKNADLVDIKVAIDKRAKAILDANDKVMVSWSGGVDSTAIICSFLKNGIDPKNLTILATSSSEEEYPWFYRYLHEVGVNYVETSNVVNKINETTDEAIVMGWCADQLFGSNVHLRNLDWYHLPWMEGVQLALKDRGVDVEAKELGEIQDVFTEYSKLFGVNMKQFCEFAFLFNFGVKWSYVSQDTYMSVSDQSIRDRIYNFFEPVEFQHYALQNYSTLRILNTNRVKKYYKRPLKEYIYSLTDEDYYFRKKGKKNSWALTEEDWSSIGTLDTDGYHRFKLPKGFTEYNRYRLIRKLEEEYLKVK